jgi:NAD(P)-dependent dehydrogenase (short-subunit alcohol dehydrogenase family)
MLANLEGRVAVITGGGSGIGAALARACAGAGMKVVIADVNEDRAESIAESVAASAAAVRAIAVDVANPASVERFADAVDDAFGAPHLLCNNAGVSPLGLLWEFAPADWEWILGVNVVGVANCIRSFVPRMIARGGDAHIVNTASAAAFAPAARLGAYSATKHAVLGMSDALRMDLAPHGIGVSVLCPGGVNTNIAQTLTRVSSKDPQKELAADLDVFMVSNDDAFNVPIEADRVAELVLRGVRENASYIVTAPGAKPVVAQRFDAILAAHDRAREIDPTLP